LSGTNNFKEFNSSLTNIESDSSYNTDTTRINGVGTGMASSLLHNKLFRQASVMVTALAQFIANTNNNVSDTSLANLITAMTTAIASKNDLNTWALNKTVADTGTANSYKVSSGFSYNALYTGMIIKFVAVNANTGASVINVDNLGNISLVKSISTVLVSGDITASQIISAIYDGTNFEIIPDYSVLVTNLSNTVASNSADTTYQVATGTATAIIVTMATLVSGYAKTFIASANNSGSATTINGKPLYKPSTVIAPTLIAGKAYTVWYNLASDCFFIKASATGSVVVANVLAGQTFSNETDTDLTGTMADLTALTVSGTAWTAQPWVQRAGQDIIDVDFISNNTGKIAPSTVFQIGIVNLVPKNVISGITIGVGSNGLAGTATIASLGGKKYATATVAGTTAGVNFTVSGLGFTPRLVVCGVYVLNGLYIPTNSYNLSTGGYTSGASLVSGGFTICANSTSSTWYAWE